MVLTNPEELSSLAESASSPTRLMTALASVKDSLIPLSQKIDVVEDGVSKALLVTRTGYGPLKTHFGDLHLLTFKVNDRWYNYQVIFKGDLDERYLPVYSNHESLLLRIDSGCLTGQAYGDRTCDCRTQLMLAMKIIQEAGEGMIVCIPGQDGRGMGTEFKLATMKLIDELGLDTVQAAQMLAGSEKIDERSYGGAIAILKFLGIHPDCQLKLLTHNPKKTDAVVQNGFKFEHVPVTAPPTPLTLQHLKAKQSRLGHKGLLTLTPSEMPNVDK